MTIIYILLIGVFFWGLSLSIEENAVKPYIAGFALGITFMFAIMSHIKSKSITPLDVYRGNTELEITSVNGVPTDTVVVFKNNIY